MRDKYKFFGKFWSGIFARNTIARSLLGEGSFSRDWWKRGGVVIFCVLANGEMQARHALSYHTAKPTRACNESAENELVAQ